MGVDLLHLASFLALIISVSSAETSKGQPAHNGIAYANFKAHSKSYLNITSVGTELVQDMTDCAFACVAKDSCFSFNLARNKTLPRLCELLPSDKHTNADKFVASEFNDHFSIPSPCSSGPCQNNGTCEPVYETNSFLCLCGKRYMGKNCGEKVDGNCNCSSGLGGKKSCKTGYRLVFPEKRTIENYAMKQQVIASNLSAFSVCFFLKAVADGFENHVISYAKDDDNDLYISFTRQGVEIWIYDGGITRDILLADGTWHHCCFTWNNTNGEYKFYKDGKLEGRYVDFKKGHIIPSGGVVVLGQDQDSIGGGFNANEALVGELTELNMWDSVLSESDVAAQYENCSIPHGSVLAWPLFKDVVYGNVIVIEP